MIKNSINPFIKKAALSLAGLPILHQLNKESKNIVSIQTQIMHSIIDECKDTVFGKEHAFKTIRTFEDYRKAVPVRDFEGFRPYIASMCRGSSDVLFPGKPLFYNTTSGTTDKPKLIPVSKKYYEKAYNGISKLWFYTCLRDNPRLFHGKNISSVAPAVEGYVEDGTPFGSISGVVYKNIPGILRDLYSTPYPVLCIKDYLKKYYAMMRFGLAYPVSYIISVNPSTILQFQKTVLDNGPDLVKDIYDGTLRSDVLTEIDSADRNAVLVKIKPDRERARWLESLFAKFGQSLRPKHYWPDLVCINTWKQGNCSQILPKFDGYFSENIIIREFGYQASEARAGIVMGNEWNYSLLLANIFLFEFVEPGKNADDPSNILGPHELEINKCYYILFSNGSGLYRYNINDIIRVTGFYNQFPLFEFVQKGDGVTSLTGEKLSELQVIQAVEQASKAKNMKIEFFTMFCDVPQYCYKLYVEFSQQCTQHQKHSFVASVDEHLQFVNIEYAAKRGSHRLKIPSIVELETNSYELLKKRLLDSGIVREGQYKVCYLRNDQKVQAIFESMRKF